MLTLKEQIELEQLHAQAQREIKGSQEGVPALGEGHGGNGGFAGAVKKVGSPESP